MSETAPDDLRADCERCFALCCVAPAFSASTDFAIDKPAGSACPNLRDDFGCGIHKDLRLKGFPGCTVYDCFGAGQKVAQVTFGGRSWRDAPETARQMFDVVAVVRALHELMWYLVEAQTLQPVGELHRELRAAYTETDRLTRLPALDLERVDVTTHRDEVNALLLRTSEAVRSQARRMRVDRRGADLIGATLRNADLRCASVRGALLIGANLRGADLTMADVIGADFRGTDLSGADLSDSIFLIQSQIDAANGDQGTRLPARINRPRHW